MSFQDGWIEVKKRKHRTQFLLRYWVRDLSWPEGWKKKSEILKGCTTRKQAERERIRRMEEINKSNQASASTMLGPTAMTLEDFSRTVWPHYLQTRGAKESTVYGYESLLRAHSLGTRLKTAGPDHADRRVSVLEPIGQIEGKADTEGRSEAAQRVCAASDDV